jgi:hypothetical protein
MIIYLNESQIYGGIVDNKNFMLYFLKWKMEM